MRLNETVKLATGKQGGLRGRRPLNSIPRQPGNQNFTQVNFVAGCNTYLGLRLATRQPARKLYSGNLALHPANLSNHGLVLHSAPLHKPASFPVWGPTSPLR